MILGVITPQRN